MADLDWKDRPPAKLTIESLKELNDKVCKLKDRDQEFALTTQGMGDKLDNISDKLTEHVKQQDKDFSELKTTLKDFISSADAKYADKEQFLFWRWVLIAGVLLSGAIGIWFKQ